MSAVILGMPRADNKDTIDKLFNDERINYELSDKMATP
jgi:hypothetical protein